MADGEGVLCPSSNGKCYRIGADGPDLVAGRMVAVLLAGHWIRGLVYCGPRRYDQGGMVVGSASLLPAYYLEVEDVPGFVTLCGLCTGMLVRRLW